MPGVDGTRVYEWITEHAPALEPCVIFCTGGAFTPRGSQLVERHADRMLQKPFASDELQAALDRLVRT